MCFIEKLFCGGKKLDFKVGQVWESRDGRLYLVTRILNSKYNRYPVSVIEIGNPMGIEDEVDFRGRKDIYDKYPEDLVELISERSTEEPIWSICNDSLPDNYWKGKLYTIVTKDNDVRITYDLKRSIELEPKRVKCYTDVSITNEYKEKIEKGLIRRAK